VTHDILMARLGRWVRDKRMLRIIGRFLRAGLMQDEVCTCKFRINCSAFCSAFRQIAGFLDGI
jgi:hypothetical protein